MPLTTVIYFDPVRDRAQPRRLSVPTEVASAMVRAGAAAPVNAGDYAALSVGGALDGGSLIPFMLVHGTGNATSRIMLPAAVAAVAAQAGAGSAVDTQLGVTIPAILLSGNLWTNLTEVRDYGTNYPFRNRMKTARAWILGGGATLNGQGEPTAPGSATAVTLAQVEPLGFRQATLSDPTPDRWLLRWTGTATASVLQGVTVAELSAPNYLVFDQTATGDAPEKQILVTGGSFTNYSLIPLGEKAVYDAIVDPLDPAIFTPAFLDACRPYGGLRFMDWAQTNGSAETNWADRPKVADASWALRGVPWEVMVALCKATNTDGWFCLPFLYTPASRQALLAYLYSAMGTLGCVIENTNEPWNFGFAFAQSQQAQALGAAKMYDAYGPGPGNNMTWMGDVAVDISLEAQAAFAGNPKRLTLVANMQTGYQGLFDHYKIGVESRGYKVSDVISAFALTYYFEGGINSTDGTNQATIGGLADQYNGGNASQKLIAVGKIVEQARVGGQPGFADSGIPASGLKTILDGWVTLAAAEGVDIACYEGQACHWNLDNMSDAESGRRLPLLKAALESPAMGDVLLDLLQYYRSRIRGPITLFTDFGVFGKYGPWGTRDTLYSPPSRRSAVYTGFQAAPGVAAPAQTSFSVAPPVSSGTVTGGSKVDEVPVIVGGVAPYRCAVTVGTLPPGRSIKGTRIVGAFVSPTSQQTYNYTLTYYDGGGATVSFARTTVVKPRPTQAYPVYTIAIDHAQLNPDGQPVDPYSVSIAELIRLDIAGNVVAWPAGTTATASTFKDANTADKVVDGDSATGWQSTDYPPDPHGRIAITLGSPARVEGVRIVPRGFAWQAPRKFRMYAQGAGQALSTSGVVMIDYDDARSTEVFGAYRDFIGCYVDEPAPPAEQAETTALASAMSPAPSSARRGQIDALIAGLKIDGVWGKLDWLVLLAAHSGSGDDPGYNGRINWRAPAKLLTPVNAPIFTVDRGYAGDGASAYLDFNEVPTATGNHYSLNSAAMGYWCNAQGAGGDALQVGISGSSSALSLFQPSSSGGQDGTYLNDGSFPSGHSSTSRTGHRGMSRTGPSSVAAYFNGTQTSAATTTSVAIPPGDMILLGGPFGSRGTDRIAAAYIGGGMSAADETSLHNRLNTYLTTIGAA